MWRLLTPAEQAGLARLALFHGGFTFVAAQRVAGVTVDILRALLRKSLVQRQPSARYSLHEVVRQFALERLHADSPAAARAQDRYCVYFDAWLHEQGERMAGPQQKDAFDAVAADFENCRHAWLLSIERGYYDLANQALEGLYSYTMARMIVIYFADLMRAGLERLPMEPSDRAAALLQARLLTFQGCDMFWRAAIRARALPASAGSGGGAGAIQSNGDRLAPVDPPIRCVDGSRPWPGDGAGVTAALASSQQPVDAGRRSQYDWPHVVPVWSANGGS